MASQSSPDVNEEGFELLFSLFCAFDALVLTTFCCMICRILNYMRGKRLIQVLEESLRRILVERWNESANALKTGLLWTDGAACGKALADLCRTHCIRFSISADMRTSLEQGRLAGLDTTTLLPALEALFEDLKSRLAPASKPQSPAVKNSSSEKPTSAVQTSEKQAKTGSQKKLDFHDS